MTDISSFLQSLQVFLPSVNTGQWERLSCMTDFAGAYSLFSRSAIAIALAPAPAFEGLPYGVPLLLQFISPCAMSVLKSTSGMFFLRRPLLTWTLRYNSQALTMLKLIRYNSMSISARSTPPMYLLYSCTTNGLSISTYLFSLASHQRHLSCGSIPA